MKRKLFSLPSLVIGILGYAQTEVLFKYDEGGNQRYRGPNTEAKETKVASESRSLTPLESQITVDEKAFWKQIRLYPVPVNNILTIDWTEEVNGHIESVSLFEHNAVHWKFQQQNLLDLNRQLKINMTGYAWGVYVLHFTLKDGRAFSRNITKR
ncbi:hypothetical protein D1631_07510 [Chryseobacterium nematophagum]|uniref:Secretion system C-terminal sorting domain-containing protein n=1 Tax=Chryseobacterium nematophagum TaxID=2305228 RepID=A0A3M7TGN0_9FLAO|nr:hypothetical protein [Chryseobacterium nematophagum]RNA61789.1 hypothetical protein D1631_07510 [Chryseobacterium nematophagum]